MDRRFFLKSAAAAAAVAGTTDIATAAEHISSLGEEPESKPLLASAPMLQNFAETSIGVSFAVNDLANGYVLIGERKDLQDARKVLCGGYRLADIDDRVIQVRITGLKPATKYYYRIGADRIHYGGGYDMKVLGNEEDPRVYSFTTAGKDLKGKFCVINDTHVRWPAIGAELDKIAEIAPACVIWNGDASNTEEKLENLVNIFLDHSLDRKDYAADSSARAITIPAVGRTGTWRRCGCTGSPRNGIRATGTWVGISPFAWAKWPSWAWTQPRTSWIRTRGSPVCSRVPNTARRRRPGSGTP